ncbi:MAG: glycosyltransferase [Candidatus Zixiibacteriota bacterium]
MRKDRLRIMHLVACNFFGGPEKQILRQAEYLDSTLFELTLASFTDGGGENEFLRQAKQRGIKISAIRTKNAYDFGSVRRIRRALTENKVHLLCTHTYRPNILGFFAVRGTKAKQIAFSRGWTRDDLKVEFYHWLDKRLLRRLRHIVAVSEAKKMDLVGLGIPEERVEVIPNAVELPSRRDSEALDLNLRQRYNLPPDCRLVAGCGRLSPEKGHSVFLSMATVLQREFDNVRFLIVGEGPQEKRLESQGEALIQSRKLILAGFIPNFSQCLPQVDILVNASFSEGMPNVILEALSFARAVVATDVGGVREIIEDRKTGLLVEAGNAQILADRVSELLMKPELMSQLGEAGREFVARQHSFTAQAERLKELYLRVAGVEKGSLNGDKTVSAVELQRR